jgi:hypothetical protein
VQLALVSLEIVVGISHREVVNVFIILDPLSTDADF